MPTDKSVAKTVELTPFIVPNLTNLELIAALRLLGACSGSVRWIGERDAATAWAECDNTDWIYWLLANAKGRFGLPLDADWQAKCDALYADYEAKCDALYADYEAKRAPLIADYEAKRAPLYADYEAKRDAWYADWQAKRDALDADYEAKRDALDADYEAKRAPLDADWQAAIKALIVFVDKR